MKTDDIGNESSIRILIELYKFYISINYIENYNLLVCEFICRE